MSLFLHNLARFLHILARFVQEMVQDFARDAARIITCKFGVSCTFLQDLARIGARLCKIVQEKGHITCTCQASLACKILARFLHDLASSFLLGNMQACECVHIFKVFGCI